MKWRGLIWDMLGLCGLAMIFGALCTVSATLAIGVMGGILLGLAIWGAQRWDS